MSNTKLRISYHLPIHLEHKFAHIMVELIKFIQDVQ